MTKVVTVLFLRKPDHLLLAMKKRGFGAGKWNGTGGKVEPNESVKAAAIRESQEEIGVTPIDPLLVGRLHFFDQADPDFHYDARVFITDEWDGEPTETDEMRPQWFSHKDIPYSTMWADDSIWLPHLLNGDLFEGNVILNGDDLVEHTIEVVESLGEM